MTTGSIPRPFDLAAPQPADVWLWPSRLTLQAPVVAVLWQVLLARSLRVHLDPFASCALFLAVWLIYVADHLIDTARPASALAPDPPRKAFCRQHRPKFFISAAVVACLLALGASHLLWSTTAHLGWRLSAAVASYFALIHIAPTRWRKGWPREAIVGTIFTLGTFGAVWLANGENAVPLLVPALLFMLLCCANCSIIETWEWQAAGAAAQQAPNPATLCLAQRMALAGISIALGAAFSGWLSLLPISFAIAAILSAISLAALAHYRTQIPIRFVSPLADLALCTPVLVLLAV